MRRRGRGEEDVGRKEPMQAVSLKTKVEHLTGHVLTKYNRQYVREWYTAVLVHAVHV